MTLAKSTVLYSISLEKLIAHGTQKITLGVVHCYLHAICGGKKNQNQISVSIHAT